MLRRVFTAVLCTALAGCAYVVPDYYARHTILTPPPAYAYMRIVPRGVCGWLCATKTDDQGERYVPVVVVVQLVGMGPAPARIALRGRPVERSYPAALSFPFGFRAGLGEHYVDAWVAGRKLSRTFIVAACKGNGS